MTDKKNNTQLTIPAQDIKAVWFDDSRRVVVYAFKKQIAITIDKTTYTDALKAYEVACDALRRKTGMVEL